MTTLKTKPLKTFVGVLAVLSILALVIGTAGADSTTPATTPAVNSNDYQAHWGANVNITHLQTFITHLQQQGITVPSDVTTALSNGDTATVMTWLKANRPAHSDAKLNATQLQTIITHLQQQGVTVPSDVTTALQNGDNATVMAWLKTYRQAHMSTQTNGPRQFDSQKIITQLQQQGVTIPDTVTTALQNGDNATVNAWLKSYCESNKGTMAPNHQFRHHKKGTTTTPTSTPTPTTT
ncbi:MAG: hypothetical protein ABR887_04670 [Methanoregulaceae archaeon]